MNKYEFKSDEEQMDDILFGTVPEDLNEIIDNLYSYTGQPVSAAIAARLTQLVVHPNRDMWEEQCGIIISCEPPFTVWQAVRAVDPTFPGTGKRVDRIGRIIRDWERIPSRALIVDALRLAAGLLTT